MSDEQIALYLEEHHPTLEASLLSAVDASSTASTDDTQRSQRLVSRLVDEAIERCEMVDAARAADRGPLRAYAGALALATMLAGLVLLFGPNYLRQGVQALLQLSQSLQAASPYSIDVLPGDARLARGADEAITARLSGFTAEDATLLFTRR